MGEQNELINRGMRRPSIAYIAGLTALTCVALLQVAVAETNNASAQRRLPFRPRAVQGTDSKPAETNKPVVQPTIPYVPTRHDVVKDMLWMAEVGQNDLVYDLGSGDGRIVIAAVRDFGARKAVGIEKDPERVQESRVNAGNAGVADRVEFIQGDLFTNDFSQASVVTLYLSRGANVSLRSKMFRTLKPGTRIVSHQFGMGEWQPEKALVVQTVHFGMWGEMYNPFRNNPRTPDYAAHNRDRTRDTVSMWLVPALVAGIWRAKIPTSQGERELKLTLHQRLSEVTGSFQLLGQTNTEGRLGADLWGEHLRYECYPKALPYGKLQIRFAGQVHENTMSGTLAVSENDQLREHKWAAQREPADFTGTWEWPGPTGSRPVRLRMERRDGQLVASYVDGIKAVPVTDFYNFGGGFYFTLLIGRDGNGLRLDTDTGWLIGEALVEAGALKGTIEFYPYRSMGEDQRPIQDSSREWLPKRVQP